MRRLPKLLAGITLPAIAAMLFAATPAEAEPLIWGIQVEENEYRVTDGPDVYAWDFDAQVGTDELRVVWRSEGEYAFDEDRFESLENQLRVQVPISTFFDAVAGVRYDSPAGPDRIYGVVGLHGLAEQWAEVDLDLFLSGNPAARFEIEYEGLITQRITLTPSVEFDLPFTDDTEIGLGAFGPEIELGLRLSYDLVDRLIAPYVGIFYERSFGETSVLKQADGENPGSVSFVAGARILF